MATPRRLYAPFAYCIARVRNTDPVPTKRNIHSSKSWNIRRQERDGGGSKRDEKSGFSWNQVFLQWALGVYVSTPLIAILQGSLLLNDYRVNYSDAPRPLMPARGVAVAVEEDQSISTAKRRLSTWILRPFSSSSNHPTGHNRPLRLLVVGDSLAAGVGMSKSGVPILPESIARALSKALGGRAVYWTCVGTPGVSAAQIVKDIEQIEPYDPHPKGRQLERIVKEFQIRRRRWQDRRQREHVESHGGEQQSDHHEKNHTNEPIDAGNSDEILHATRKVAYEWWMNSAIRNTYREWWMQSAIRDAYRQRRQLVQEDLSVIKEIVMKPLPRLDDDDDDYYYDYYRQNLPADDREGENGRKRKRKNDDKEQRLALIHKGSLFRRPSVVPEAAAEYDVAVVLTGLNDVKEAFMPHMSSSDAPSAKRLSSSLHQVLEALENKMGGEMDLKGNRGQKVQDHRPTDTVDPIGKAAESLETPCNQKPKSIRHPLVVVPELPVAPLEIFRLVPLCWFLVPIFRAMENNKRFLASCFPDNVVFVHQPDLRWWTDDDEIGIGSIRENIQQERLLLRVTDSVRSGRERIEELMKTYYDDDSSDGEKTGKNSTSISMIRGNNRNGSDLVSVDRMHPNDEGYELWGRHIAAAIIQHWNKNA